MVPFQYILVNEDGVAKKCTVNSSGKSKNQVIAELSSIFCLVHKSLFETILFAIYLFKYLLLYLMFY